MRHEDFLLQTRVTIRYLDCILRSSQLPTGRSAVHTQSVYKKKTYIAHWAQRIPIYVLQSAYHTWEVIFERGTLLFYTPWCKENLTPLINFVRTLIQSSIFELF